MASFQLPTVQVSADGWGPTSTPEQFDKLPFAPFKKNERLGKAADWNATKNYARRMNNYSKDSFGASGSSSFFAGQDDTGFNAVDSSARVRHAAGTGWQRQRKAWRKKQNATRKYDSAKGGSKNDPAKYTLQPKRNKRRNWWNRNRFKRNWTQEKIRDSSVEIRDEYEKIREIKFSWLQNQSRNMKSNPIVPKDVMTAGTIYPFVPKFAKCTARNKQKLLKFENVQHFNVTASQDPILKEFAAKKQHQVFTTDTVLSMLMAAMRSVYSWDIVITKKDGQVWLDQRLNSKIDFLTCNENANEPSSDDVDSINHPNKLRVESTLIDHNYGQQVVSKSNDKAVHRFERQNPFVEGLEDGCQAAGVGYRYREFPINSETNLLVRCEVNGVENKSGGRKSFVSIHTLNEFDSKISKNSDWRRKLETQRGAVLMTEMRNNSAKMARWACRAYLAGAEKLKIGFVSRWSPKDPFQHEIIGFQDFKPLEISQQLTIPAANMWGTLTDILATVNKQDDGKFLLIKDPTDTLLTLYKVPETEFDHEAEEQQE